MERRYPPVAQADLDREHRARVIITIMKRSVDGFRRVASTNATCLVLVQLLLKLHRALCCAQAAQRTRIGEVLNPNGHQGVARKLDDVASMRRDKLNLARKVLVQNPAQLLDANGASGSEPRAQGREAADVDKEQCRYQCLKGGGRWQHVLPCERGGLDLGEVMLN